MKTKVLWSIFWVLVVSSISWCAYAVTPYVFGDKPLEAAEESTSKEEIETEAAVKPKIEEQVSDFIYLSDSILAEEVREIECEIVVFFGKSFIPV